jgi:hypothetical protein
MFRPEKCLAQGKKDENCGAKKIGAVILDRVMVTKRAFSK